MGAGVAAGLGRMMAGATGGMVKGKKDLLNREKEEAAAAEDKRRFDEDIDLKKQTLEHTKVMDNLKYTHGLEQDQADTYLAAIGRSIEMIRDGADPKAVEQFYNMFAERYGFDKISNMQVDPKTGMYTFHAVGGDILGFNKADNSMEVLGHYTPDSVQAANARNTGEGAIKPVDVVRHMNQLLKEYGGDEKSMELVADGGFKFSTGGSTAFKSMQEEAKLGDLRATQDLGLYNELKVQLEELTTGGSKGLKDMMGPSGVFGSTEFKGLLERHESEGGSNTPQAMAAAFIDYYVGQGLPRPQAIKKAKEAMKSIGLENSEE
jgi:hypothetical protein